MLTKTTYSVPLNLLIEASKQIPGNDFKLTLNRPIGRFFYDSWELFPEFKNTVWEEIYNTLPINKGEARLINLKKESCYVVHSDIDDRYHLNITGSNSYLLDLDNNKTIPIMQDGIWYDMDAGVNHSAVNCGVQNRVQLVVRKLLNDSVLNDPVRVMIKPIVERSDLRFIFDKALSPWLNHANKSCLINNFIFDNAVVTLNLEKFALPSLQTIMPAEFQLVIG